MNYRAYLRLIFLQVCVFFNKRCSEAYRRYNKAIPKYLHNKPRPFLNHCKKRMNFSSEIRKKDIKEISVDTKNGQFHVRSQSSNIWYELSFGSESNMPRCSCPDFSNTGLPCKHFFAIFSNYPKWQWDSLPEQYREHPQLSLDREHMFANQNTSAYEGSDKPNVPGVIRSVSCLKTEDYNGQVRQGAMKCRETLKGLISLTYNIENINALNELRSSLHLIYC